MIKKPFVLNPQVLYLYILILQCIISLLVSEFNTTVFLLFMVSFFSLLLRWRIPLKPSYMLIDLLIFIIISSQYSPATLFLFLYAYYFSYKNKFLYIIPIIITGLMSTEEIVYYVLLAQAVLFGTILYYWEKDNRVNKNINDNLRLRIYELESIQAQLLSDYQDTERISRLTERHKIAEILHDNLGHELTAAHLSLKAYKTLLSSNQLQPALLQLNKTEQRLENALSQLKDTVKTIEPVNDLGLTNLRQLLYNYIYPIEFRLSGDTLKLKPYLWQLIMMSVKEALTNIIKHANPKTVNVNLEITDYIVRLIIENDGIKGNSVRQGHGLRYMRNRLEAVNGSLSIQSDKMFKLIIIIPLNNG